MKEEVIQVAPVLVCLGINDLQGLVRGIYDCLNSFLFHT